MIQSMEILQLPLMALEERIEQEIQDNETLEVVEPEAEPTTPETAGRGGGGAAPIDEDGR